MQSLKVVRCPCPCPPPPPVPVYRRMQHIFTNLPRSDAASRLRPVQCSPSNSSAGGCACRLLLRNKVWHGVASHTRIVLVTTWCQPGEVVQMMLRLTVEARASAAAVHLFCRLCRRFNGSSVCHDTRGPACPVAVPL